jgi:hypothetical protein
MERDSCSGAVKRQNALRLVKQLDRLIIESAYEKEAA